MSTAALNKIRSTLYSLKRKYGMSAVINRRNQLGVDLETGVKTITADSWTVDRMIILPSMIHRQFIYDLTFIATNKNFTYGGQFDTNNRRVILDARDMPSDWRPVKDDYIVFDGVRYEINEIFTFEQRAGYLFDLRALIGQINYNNPELSVVTTIYLDQEVEVQVD